MEKIRKRDDKSSTIKHTSTTKVSSYLNLKHNNNSIKKKMEFSLIASNKFENTNLSLSCKKVKFSNNLVEIINIDSYKDYNRRLYNDYINYKNQNQNQSNFNKKHKTLSNFCDFFRKILRFHQK